MIDIIYVLTTLLFFGLMIAYVVGCERLGRGATNEAAAEERSRT